jgi:serine/threonine protein kinase
LSRGTDTDAGAVANRKPCSNLSVAAGTKLGRYEIRSKIGEGGMGEVYLARDTQLGRDVAVMVLPSNYSDDKERLHRFEQEACAASALNHPNILSIYDVGTHDGSPCSFGIASRSDAASTDQWHIASTAKSN